MVLIGVMFPLQKALLQVTKGEMYIIWMERHFSRDPGERIRELKRQFMSGRLMSVIIPKWNLDSVVLYHHTIARIMKSLKAQQGRLRKLI